MNLFVDMSAGYPTERRTKPSRPATQNSLSVLNKEAHDQNKSVFEQSLPQSGTALSSYMDVDTGLQQSFSPLGQFSYSNDMHTTPTSQALMKQDDQRGWRGSAKLSSSLGESSQMDVLMRENVELRQEIGRLHTDSEERQVVFEDMLGNVIRSEALLEESKRALSVKDAEVISLRDEVARLVSETQNKVDEQAITRIEAHHASELDSVQRVSEFYQKNSAEVARKNGAIVAENTALQKYLNEMERELDEQRSLIKTLQDQ